MSRIDDLIREHCPDGVPFRHLSEVARRNSGTPITAARMKTLQVEGGAVRIFAGGNTIADVPESAIPADHITRDPSIIVKSRGHIGFSFYERPFSHKNELWSYTVTNADCDQKFVYYFLVTQAPRLEALARANSVKLPQLTVRQIDAIRVPVPPIEVQREIVRVLDLFQSLEAELEAELEARRRQYAHYRDALLTFDEGGVRWMAMGEVCRSVSSGGTPLATQADYYGGDIPWLRTQEVVFAEVFDTEVKITDLGLAASSAKWIPSNCVIVAISGATAARVAINKIPLTTNQHCCNLEIDEDLANFRYVFHWLSREYRTLKALGHGARSDLNASIIKGFPIALPPLSEQERIVAILDQFDALVNDLSVGLPAELAARRKQYEYYRDRLLTFEEAA